MSEAEAHLDEDTIVRYVQGHLDTEILHRWDRHLDACSPCRRLLAEVAKSGVLDGDDSQPLAFEDHTNVTAPEAMEPGGGLFAVGEMVDHFRIIRTLGRGGMGEVFLARDTKLGRKVALKVILSRYLGSPTIKKRFMFEARATANFSHPHIVAIYDVGEVHDRPYVALEYLDGDSLRIRLNQERPSIWTTLRVALAIAEALAEAHAHDILHRDLKPENVIIPTDGRLRVVDFGLAQAVTRDPTVARVEHDAGLMTRRPTNIEPMPKELPPGGTPAYMAPEQWRGVEATAASDVWSLGVILYEMVTGHRPYGDGAGTRESMERDVLATAPVPTLEDVRALPTRVPALIYRCLVKQPTRRPSAAELADELRELLAFRHTKIVAEEDPFRGLRTFDEEDAAGFFGRDAQIDALVERLRIEPSVAVIGPSGSGKSSLVHAGLAPRLTDLGGWRILRMRPGKDPYAAMDRALGRDAASGPSQTPDEDETKLMFDDGTAQSRVPLAVELTRIAQTERVRVLLIVDQMEELFSCDDKTRLSFIEDIAHAVDDPMGPVRLIVTLREDFLGQLTSSTARALVERVMVVRPPSREVLHRILERTVESADLRFEDEALSRRIVNDLGDEPGALALMQLTGSQLWAQHDRKTKLLTHRAYRSIGGVSGALIVHADSVIGRLTPDQTSAVQSVFSRLVDKFDFPTEVPASIVNRDEAEILEDLIEARLVGVRWSMSSDGPQIHLAHRALITWPRLVEWIGDQRSASDDGADSEVTHQRPLGMIAAIALLSLLVIIGVVDRVVVNAERRQATAAWALAERDAARAALERGASEEAAARLRTSLELKDDALTRALWSSASGVDVDARFDWCETLRLVWKTTPTRWQDGQALEVEADHECE